jgi:hypothetical protein
MFDTIELVISIYANKAIDQNVAKSDLRQIMDNSFKCKIQSKLGRHLF